jgi:ATP-dependent protease ClpP protease subunit
MREILIYDEIGPEFWGLISARTIIAELDEIHGDEDVTVRINSPGGDMFEATAIYNAIVRRGGVTVSVDSLAASAASYIAMAGARITMAENAMMMIHEPYTITWGTADELRATAGILEKSTQIAANTYALRSGQSVDKVAELLKAETWMTAAEAKELGFADDITESLQVQANVRPKQFKRQPEQLNTPRRDDLQRRAVAQKLARMQYRLDILARRVA